MANAVLTGKCLLDQSKANMFSFGLSVIRGMRTVLPSISPPEIEHCSSLFP